MTLDPRVTLANGRVAHVSLEGHVTADRFVDGQWMMVQQPMADILVTPDGGRTSQLLFGERVLVLDIQNGYAFAQAERDGQVGYVLATALVEIEPSTHWVITPATHLYPHPEIKCLPAVALFFGSQLSVQETRDGFHRIHTGHYVPAQHVAPINARFDDPVAVADLFLGIPYLWGGTSRWGIDCSGLVQTALTACGIACPRDSDQQAETLGQHLAQDAPLERGDLIFWDGHVGMLSAPDTLLHANAHHMTVAYEPLEEAVTRIAAVEFGDITAIKRLG